MKAVIDLPASLLRKARAAARARGVTIEKLAARGFQLAIKESPASIRRRRMTGAEREAMLAREAAVTEMFRVPPKDPRPVAELVSAMRR